MKHTDFYSLVQEIKQKEQKELYNAVAAHGGSYSWWNESEKCFLDVEYPIIAINFSGIIPTPMDVEIRSVRIENDSLVIIGEDKEDGNLVDFSVWDVFAGHLGYIIDLIEPTEKIEDVTTPQESFEVSYVSRDDLIHCGFDAKNLSDDMMRKIASKLNDSYLDNGYFEDLREHAREMEIPRMCDEWFQQLDFMEMERITGFSQFDFSPEDGYQDFVDACEEWWNKLTTKEKNEIYEDYAEE